MIYEYSCSDCSHRYEENRKVDDRNNVSTCPSCKNNNTRRLISTPSFKTAGGGHLQPNGEGKTIV